MCDEGSKEKLTIEVEFDADRSSTDKGDYGKTSSSSKSLFNELIARGRKNKTSYSTTKI